MIKNLPKELLSSRIGPLIKKEEKEKMNKKIQIYKYMKNNINNNDNNNSNNNSNSNNNINNDNNTNDNSINSINNDNKRKC